MRSTKLNRAALPLLALTAATLAACSGDRAPRDAAPASTAAATPAAAANGAAPNTAPAGRPDIGAKFDGIYYGLRKPLSNSGQCGGAPLRTTMRVTDGRLSLQTLDFSSANRSITADVLPNGSLSNTSGGLTGKFTDRHFDGQGQTGSCSYDYDLSRN